jgi:hypothetical protein
MSNVSNGDGERRRVCLLTLLLFLLVFQLSVGTGCHPNAVETRERIARTAVQVSMTEALDHPLLYSNKAVIITGYFHSEFEESALYTTSNLNEGGERKIWVGGLAAGLKSTAFFDDGRATITGILYAGKPHGYGYMGLYRAELSSIVSVKNKKNEELLTYER